MEHYKKALEQIANPVKFLTEEAEKQGNKLNGGMAVAISNDPIWLREIARNALMYNPVTEDKKAPVEEDKTEPELDHVEYILNVSMNLGEPERREELTRFLQEHAKNERTKAIQEAIDLHTAMRWGTWHEIHDQLIKLSKIKK